MGRVKLAWSCDEKDRNKCRNSHGCHCREITALLAMRKMLEAQIQKVSPHAG